VTITIKFIAYINDKKHFMQIYETTIVTTFLYDRTGMYE